MQQVVVVAVTKHLSTFLIIGLCSFYHLSNAAVLPEERVDLLYHKYDGGGITIDGPSIVVRKNFDEQVSVTANHYVDSITSASIDVLVSASVESYTEERTQQSLGVDYLYEKSTLNYSYTNSLENDFDGTTHSFGVTQEMFGGLSTVSLGYSIGSNIITKTKKADFEKESSFKNYRVSLGQVLTKKLILSLAYNIITDEGFLNNPYREYRYEDTTASTGYNFSAENYPDTRTSNAVSFNLRYYLPYRAAVFGGYRFFTDSWGIKGDTYEVGYIHPFENNWTLELGLRYYQQTQADFYSDLFPFGGPLNPPQNFFGRDKELSTFSDYTINIGVSYKFENLGFVEKATANLFYSHIQFDYDNFTDVSDKPTIGNEPLYSFSAGVTRLFFSFWF